MFIFGIRYLNGWAMATHPADRDRPEWPPHPDRVFMALAAAHFETDGDASEREALEWLETLGPPTIIVGRHRERTTVTTFVPVNDRSDPIKKNKPLMPAGSMPIGRDRQARQFPVAILPEPEAYLTWESATLTADREAALDALCRKVTSIGHSASLVQMWLAREQPDIRGNGGNASLARLKPTGAALSRYRFRVIGPGRLGELEARYNRTAIEDYAELQRELTSAKSKRKKELRATIAERYGDSPPQSLRPTSGLWHEYAPVEPPRPPAPVAQSYFDSNLIILRQVRGHRFGLPSSLKLTHALRRAAIKAIEKAGIVPQPEWFSGHQQNGQPSKRDTGHVAFLPLPHVGRTHADGHLLGLALAIPSDVPREELARYLNPLLFDELGVPKEIKLFFGRFGDCVFEMDERQDFRMALRSDTWTSANQPSRRWATVTPIALDRQPKLNAEEKQELAGLDESQRRVRKAFFFERYRQSVIANGCERIGLPRPQDVILSPISMFIGAPTIKEMPRMERKNNGGIICHTHAILTFAEPVCAPVLIGAGRYRGYGFCRPLRTGELA